MKFAIPFFKELIPEDAKGYDIGCNRPEWAYPGAMMIEPLVSMYDAMNLPVKEVDFIVSSHCLEHIPVRIGTVLEYWLTRIKKGGLICLYLPNCDQQRYWAFGNTKHVHYLNPIIMRGVCAELGATKFIVTNGADLNSSFYVIIEK